MGAEKDARPRAGRKAAPAFSAEERAAMRARAKEQKAHADGEQAVREALEAMAPADRAIGERVHAIVREAAPHLVPRTWYGMPAYAGPDGKVVCFFRDAGKFKERYAVLGFNERAQLDAGRMWPVAYAVVELDASVEAEIRGLVARAAG